MPARIAHPAAGPTSAHRVGCEQKAQHSPRVVESALDTLDIISALRLVVREDHDCAPGVATPVSRDVGGRVEHGARNIRAPVKRLLPEKPLQLVVDLVTGTPERQPDARGPVEDHDRYAVIGTEHVHSFLRRESNPFHVRAHAAANVEQ